jgi:enoyl-CoA hydratase/carnithine racemase
MQDRPYRAILASTDGGVLTLTLNRPEKRNAIGTEMVNELCWALSDAGDDANVRVVVLTGAGNTFCAGGDFSQMTGGGGESPLPHKGDYRDLLLALWHSEKPVVARVNGHAMGGGLGLVAASTFAVASTEAKLGTPEIDVGLFPFMIMAVLERVMPRRRLVEMMLFGERLPAEAALAAGLVNAVAAPAELDAEVKRFTDRIVEKSPSTIRLGLQAMRDTEDLGLAEKLPILSERLGSCLATNDAREGLMAFLEKRAPKWTGS